MIDKIIAKIKNIFSFSRVEEDKLECAHTRYAKRLERFCLDCGKHLSA
jgi:hypothetical protein